MEKHLVVNILEMHKAGACCAEKEVICFDPQTRTRQVRKDYTWFIPGVGRVKSLAADKFVVAIDTFNYARIAVLPWLRERNVSYSFA